MSIQIPVLGLESLNESSFESPESFSGIGAQLAESEKWKPWVEDIEDDYTRGVTAFLMEAEERYAKVGLQQSGLFTEATMTTGIANFTNFALPLVRSIVPNLVSSEIVSVQPMTGPTSVVFYMKLIAGSDKGAVKRGTELYRQNDNTAASEYASEAVEGEVPISGAFSANGTESGNLSYTPVRPGSVTLTIEGQIVLVDDGDGNLVKQSGSNSLGTGTNGNTINYETGAIIVSVGTAIGDSTTEVVADYRFDMEGSEDIPEVDISITSSPVVARPRKLRSRWSMEAAHNLRAIHGIEADSEIGAHLVSEIRFEIDREVIKQLQSIGTAGTVTFDPNPSEGLGLIEHLQSFKQTLTNAGGLVYDRTKRASGNFVVAGRRCADILEVVRGFSSSGSSGQHGVMSMGTIDGRWNAYRDSYMGQDDFLFGHKGSSFMDTGYILAMYVPLYSTPVVILDDFVARRGLGSLYAKKAVDSRYYGTGTIAASN